MAYIKTSKHIKFFTGTDIDVTAEHFIRIVVSDINAKIGLPPDAEFIARIAITNDEMTEQLRLHHGGVDNEQTREAVLRQHIFDNPLIRTREWRNWMIKKQGIFGNYLAGLAQEWFFEQLTANPEYFYVWEDAMNAFRLRFDTDVQKGAAELKLESMRRRENESIVDWNTRVKGVIQIAFGHEPELSRTEKLRTHFKKGLPPTLLREYNREYLRDRNIDHNIMVNRINTIAIADGMSEGTLNPTNNSQVLMNRERRRSQSTNSDEEMINIYANEDNPRQSSKFRQFCNYCGKNGHMKSTCFQKENDENAKKISTRSRTVYRKEPPITFNKVFNPTKPSGPFVRPQGGDNGNIVQNDFVQKPNRYPPRTFDKKPPNNNFNYHQGQRTPFNLNLGRGPNKPGTTNYPYRYPSPSSNRFNYPGDRLWNTPGSTGFHKQLNANNSFRLSAPQFRPPTREYGNIPRNNTGNLNDYANDSIYRRNVVRNPNGNTNQNSYRPRQYQAPNRYYPQSRNQSPQNRNQERTRINCNEIQEKSDSEENQESDDTQYEEPQFEEMSQDHLN